MRALDYLFFCRPLLLIPVWTVFLLLYDIEFPNLPFPRFQLANLALLSGLTSAGYIINQIYDRDGDRINQKLGFFDAPVGLKIGAAWGLYVALVLLAFIFAVNQRELLGPYGASVIAGALYSVPFFRGKDRPFVALALNAIPYSVVIWWALTAVERGGYRAILSMGAESALPLGALAAALGGIYLLTTVPDIDGDRETGKVTIAVRYGVKAALFGALWLLVGALGLAIYAKVISLSVTAALAVGLCLLALWTKRSNQVLLAAKAPILALSAFVCYQHPYYGVFLLALVGATRVYYKLRFGLVYPRLN